MVWIPGGTFRMGSENHYAEEAPVHSVTVDGFWMDQFQVTNAQFAMFVRDTGYVTVAERPPDPELYPDAPAENLVPGSLVFKMTKGPVNLRFVDQWWDWTPGACWRRPGGPGTNVRKRQRHPVVHIAYEDAVAYAEWAGKELPAEAEWEFAARGGIEGAEFTWGDEHTPDGKYMANTWQGEFPWQNLVTDGYEDTAPVGSFPANPYGLHDMAGNGLDRGLVDGGSPCRARQAVLHPRKPAGRQYGAKLRSPGPALAHSAPGGQRRLVPVCAQLLPALQARSAAPADDRYRYVTRQLPLRGPAG
jgi:formylglycine-generating enzyme required for sulfatase activity